MKKELEISVQPNLSDNYEAIKKIASRRLKININKINAVKILRRSIDARRRPVFRLRLGIWIGEEPVEETNIFDYKSVGNKKSVFIIGGGPAGLFAALRLLELGVKPVILERGKDVKSRRRDIRAIQREGSVDADSNYCFGEGGAGTFSDGKLYTRSTKRGDVNRILQTLVNHGAQKEILIDAHPHIGSNILPKVVSGMRETIINFGGEVRFNNRVTDLIINKNKVEGVIVNNSDELLSNAVILAAGHSARDIFYLLKRKNILLESKEFAMGVRIEHPQQLIDSIQYHSSSRPENLPASSYNLKSQVDDHGVYSFCMCPGGIIIPASTENDGLTLNGMSISKRNSPFANSGLVVTVTEKDLTDYNYFGVFAGLEFQREFEKAAFDAGGGKQKAPAQRLSDFADKKLSNTLPDSSYIPGVHSAPLHEIIPVQLSERLRESLLLFDKKMKGYFSNEALVLAAESRTSSPIRIPRDKESLMHIEVAGLFPSGEGAGYAGGIVSSAIDGERCANAACKFIM